MTATGLREGRGSDNPQEFYEVFMNTADDRRFGGASGSCDDYDTCPADAYGNMVCGSLPQRDGVWPGTDGVDCGFGISGYGRPPGQRADILNCRLRPGTPRRCAAPTGCSTWVRGEAADVICDAADRFLRRSGGGKGGRGGGKLRT